MFLNILEWEIHTFCYIFSTLLLEFFLKSIFFSDLKMHKKYCRKVKRYVISLIQHMSTAPLKADLTLK